MAFDPVKYHEWRKEMADKRKACLACEFEEWSSKAEADELEACRPNADPHEGPYCKRETSPVTPTDIVVEEKNYGFPIANRQRVTQESGNSESGQQEDGAAEMSELRAKGRGESASAGRLDAGENLPTLQARNSSIGEGDTRNRGDDSQP